MRRVIALVAAALITSAAATATAQRPHSLRLSWAVSETAGTMTVAWNTDTEVPTQVRWGRDPSYPNIADGTAALAPGDIGWVHEVTLTGLEPDTVYYYRVGSEFGWSDDRTFRSPPASDGCTPFSFVALGDNRSDDDRGPSPKWAGILGEAVSAAEPAPAFVINTGDLVKEGKEADQWALFLEETGEHAAYVPLMPSIGNHDDGPVEGDGAIYNAVFALPRNEANGTEDFYWFTYGDAIFVCLSTASFEGGAAPYEQQAAWLDQVLTEHPKPWKFVYFHHPPFTGYVNLFGLDFNHPPNENDQNQALVPIFDKHHVDIVFNGHNHFYQRFEPMQYSTQKPEEGIPVGDPAQGTIYAITGGAGALTYAIDLYMTVLCLAEGSASCDGRHHYIWIEIDGNRLQYTVVTTAQQLFGSSPDNVEIIESFEIVKPGYAPNCVQPPVDEGPRPDAGGGPDVGAPDVATGEPDAGTPPSDVPAPPGPDVAAAAEDGATGGLDTVTPGAEDVPGTPGADVPAPGPDTAAAGPDAGTTGGGSGEGGCSAGGGAPAAPVGLLLLVLGGLIGVVRRLRGNA